MTLLSRGRSCPGFRKAWGAGVPSQEGFHGGRRVSCSGLYERRRFMQHHFFGPSHRVFSSSYNEIIPTWRPIEKAITDHESPLPSCLAACLSLSRMCRPWSSSRSVGVEPRRRGREPASEQTARFFRKIRQEFTPCSVIAGANNSRRGEDSHLPHPQAP